MIATATATEPKHAAIADIKKGYPVTPLKVQSKAPKWADWPERPITSVEDWPKTHRAGHGIVLRDEHRLLLVDVDMKNGKNGADSLRQLTAEAGVEDIGRYTYQKTPSGGLHMLGRVPAGYPLASLPNKADVLPGVDVLHNRKQFVRAPSMVVLKNGTTARYKATKDLPPLEDLPEWPSALLDALATHGGVSEYTGPVDREPPPSREALELLVANLPNEEDSRDEWRNVLTRIKASAEDLGEPGLGEQLALEWSAKWEGGNDPDYVVRTYASLRTDRTDGWGSLFRYAGGLTQQGFLEEIRRGEAQGEFQAVLLPSGTSHIYREVEPQGQLKGSRTHNDPQTVDLYRFIPLPDRPVQLPCFSTSQGGPEGSGEVEPGEAEKLPPGFRTAGDLLAVDFDSDPWLVDGLIPAYGMSLLVAKPKVGKSTLARAIAVAVAQGIPVLGRDVQQGPVLYLQFAGEGGENDAQEAFRALGLTGDDPLLFFYGHHTADLPQQIGAVVKKFRPALIVADTMQKLVRASNGSDYAEGTQVLDPINVLLDTYGAHLLATHHARKAGADDPIDLASGSNAYTGGAESIITMEREGVQRYIQSTQRNERRAITTPTTIDLNPDTLWPSLGVTKARATQNEIEGRIIAFVHNWEGELSPMRQDIEDGVEGKTKTISLAITRMAAGEDGRLIKTGRGGKADPFRYTVGSEFMTAPSLDDLTEE